MIITTNWAIVCDLASLIIGIVMGVSIIRPTRYRDPYDPRY